MAYDHGDKAKALFESGYNCAQAVFCAFGDVTGLDTDTAARIASSFGGGLARMREVCGTVSGAAMVLGMVYGYSDPRAVEAKKEHYHRIQDFARQFREDNGSIICRELLSGSHVIPGDDPELRTPEYYRRRPCPELVRYAVRLVDECLNEKDE